MSKPTLRDTVVEVNLSHLKNNMHMIQEMVGKEVAIMPIVKANGYGHGAAGIAPTLIESGAAYLGVATLVEAIELREAYPNYPIFILGHTPDHLLDQVVKHNITQTIFSTKQAALLNNHASTYNTNAYVHLKVDTGFHRLGCDSNHELLEMCKMEHVHVEGIFTHLALVNKEENDKQFQQFLSTISYLESQGVTFKYKHISDSIAAVDYPQYNLNMIRPGALIYGLKGFHINSLDVLPCLTFKTRLSQVRRLQKGEGVGYDFLYTAPEDTLIGTLPFGYADGYPRNLRDKGYVSIRGVKCPIIGVICMDQCMVDLSKVPDAQEGEEAIIYGETNNNSMTIDDAASLSGTNKNEIVARISTRPPRVYINQKGDSYV